MDPSESYNGKAYSRSDSKIPLRERVIVPNILTASEDSEKPGSEKLQ
jgi:hypothetical protein